MRRRRRWGLAGLLGAMAVIALTVGSSLAFHQGDVGVELDGNIADDGADGTDWGALFDASGNPVGGTDPLGSAGNILDRDFVVDFDIGATGPDESYHEPSNKDDQPIFATGGGEVWGCESAQNPTDKDDILNAYAVGYTGEGADAGDLIVDFGVERYDDSGTAYLGFWLFQKDVGCDLTVEKFTGTKSDGDILLLVNFSNGGDNVTVNTFSWHPHPTQPTSQPGSFELIGVGVSCLTSVDNDGATKPTPITPGGPVDLCAVTNGTGVDQSVETPWTTEDKEKPGPPRPDASNTLEPPEFVEGGINLTDAFAAVGKTPPACFGSFMAETRSSDTLSATLKDFALGDLNTCDASVSITGSGTNRVGTAHTFTVTATQNTGGGAVPAQTGNVDVTLTGSNGITSSDISLDTGASTCDDAQPAGDNLSSGGTCIVVFNSSKTGQITGHATVAIDLGGGSVLVRDTDPATTTIGSGPDGSDVPAVKKYVDARISIGPNGVNRVGEDHVFTVTVEADDSGSGGFAGVSGRTVTGSITNGPGAFKNGTNTCVTGTSGTCTLTITSTVTGVTTVSASASVTVDTLPINLQTDGQAGSSGPATKRWVDARISIATNDVNKVNEAHTFTVTVEQDDGLASGAAGGDGATGFGPASGIAVSESPTGSAGSITGGTCVDAPGTTNASGICTIIVNSSSPGAITVAASATVTLGTESISLTTDGQGLNSGPATKRWVNARISITGTDTNSIFEPHTFTATVEKDDGLAANAIGGDAVTGWGPVSGLDTTVALVNGGGAGFVVDDSPEGDTTCDYPSNTSEEGTNTNGVCIVSFTSQTAGTVTGSATATLVLDGQTFNLATGTTAGTGAAVKTFVDGSIRWLKHDHNGALLGGATFEVCRTHRLNTGTGSMVAEPVEPFCFTVFDDTDATAQSPDTDNTPGEIQVDGLILGRYTVRETIPPTGYVIKTPPGAGPFNFPDMSVLNQDVNLADGSTGGTANPPAFVNIQQYRFIVIACNDVTEELVDSTVTLGATNKQSILAAQLTALGWKDSDGSALTQQDLCDMGFATFGALDAGTYNPSIELPDLDPFFP